VFGGYDAARAVHIYVGVFMLCWFALHALYVLADLRQLPLFFRGPALVTC
jgi:hypothetical protein